MRKRKLPSVASENAQKERFRAIIDNATSLSMYNEKKRAICIIKKNLAKDYEIEVDASEAPVLNKLMNEPEPYETSMADIKILEQEIFPLIDSFKSVFGEEKDLKLHSIKLAVGGSISDYVTIQEKDLEKFDVNPTLTGLREFVKENTDSILGFLDSEYISEEGNVIYLSCGKKNVSDNIYSFKIKILASMQQRSYFLQQEHKYYGLQLFIMIESREPNDDKLLEFLKELGIDWELIFFRRRLAIHDWTEIECEKDSDNLKSFIRAKYNNLNYFDINNIIRLMDKNELPFKVIDKMGFLLFKMKSERAQQIQEKKFDNNRYQEDAYLNNTIDNRTNNSRVIDEYSLTLKKAEIAAAANIACAYLGIHKEISFDRDISVDEVIKYQEELTNL
ncbi:MAG: hypothetical protein EU552_01620 [Promethearchaeota archaeon]|nr:MAG: hypothetical protein EU552_01620 [Candidatus Lokiarchaeota archaeon]